MNERIALARSIDGKVLKRRTLRRQVEALKRSKLASKKVVRLEDFKELNKTSRTERVLVVDDDEVMRNALQRILESEGFSVTLAEDGLGLSRALENSQMDLILLDVNLPWVDGFELCSLIKGHDLLRRVPLVLVSGCKSPEDVDKGFASGADHFLAKPFEVDKLLEIVDRSLAPRR